MQLELIYQNEFRGYIIMNSKLNSIPKKLVPTEK